MCSRRRRESRSRSWPDEIVIEAPAHVRGTNVCACGCVWVRVAASRGRATYVSGPTGTTSPALFCCPVTSLQLQTAYACGRENTQGDGEARLASIFSIRLVRGGRGGTP